MCHHLFIHRSPRSLSYFSLSSHSHSRGVSPSPSLPLMNQSDLNSLFDCVADCYYEADTTVLLMRVHHPFHFTTATATATATATNTATSQ
mmetsp:Transcript_27476/g.31500  ORF Transcript_27476/g.31500 Transcript_27476/m.31500 type:complete len:90 (-) Transcript_27476:309-578(-)